MARDHGEDAGGGAPPASRGGMNWLRWAPVAAFAALGVVFGVQLASPPNGALRSQLLSKPVPSFDLPVLAEGSTARFTEADLAQGRVSIVNFFASWCAPCRIEHPELMRLAERDDVTLYGVAYHDEPEKSRRFLAELGDPFATVGVDREGQTALRWGLEGVPETFVVDGAGRVVYKHTGPIDAAALSMRILPAIEAAARGGESGS